MELQSALKLSVATIFGCIVMTLAHPASADVVTIPASQDATLFGASSANNNSSSGPGMFVGSDGMSRPKRGLIEFNIPAFVPAGATITSASLSLVLGQVAGADATPRTIGLFDVTTNWASGTNGAAGFPGPGFGAPGKVSPPISATRRGTFPSTTRSHGIRRVAGAILFPPRAQPPLSAKT
jgi:hypothetical protein